MSASTVYLRPGSGPLSAHDIKRMCAWCGRIQDGLGRWRLVDPEPGVTRTSHGLCGLCASKVEAQIEEFERKGILDQKPGSA